MSGGPGAGPSCWLLIPRSIPQIPGSRRLRELELCGKVFSGHLLSPLCVPSPSPCGLRHSKTSSFLLPFSRLPWLVLSERGWVRGEEVWQLGLLLGFGVITGGKVQNKEGCKQEPRF